MPILFISDLHLEPAQPKTTELFYTFVRHYAATANAVYILGDLFEAWIGDDDSSPFIDSIKSALTELTRKGTQVYFMRGNRDFLLGKKFANETGMQLLEDPTVIHIFGHSILLTHGDYLCTEDIKHQQFRKYAHNPKYNWIYLMLPLMLRRIIARKIRNSSQKHTRTTSAYMMDVNTAEVVKTLRQYQVNLLIHGHTHKPAIHSLMIDHQSAKRIVLDAWHEKGNFLVFREDGSFELMDFFSAHDKNLNCSP